jgi:type IV pilus assembly protein PilO
MKFDISSLDYRDIGSWPTPFKTVVVIILCGLTLFAGYWFDTKEQIAQLQSAEKKEVGLKKSFERKQAKAVNLEAYKKQLAEMKQSFGAMLKQLPGKTEVAELLVDISQTGLASGLEFELFKPGRERPVEFYAELPISLRVKGSYHEFGNFVSGVAALPRIVTLHNFKINRAPKSRSLIMEATAKTYRYLDEEEQAKLNKKKTGNKKGKKKRR